MSHPVKSAKPFKPVIATGNHLASGAVVFRLGDGTWSIDIARAEVADSPEAADQLLARSRADEGACLVVDAALIEVVREGGLVRPASLRELIRASGPTVALPADAYAPF
jgi:Protein of unknown function (DUF2849)